MRKSSKAVYWLYSCIIIIMLSGGCGRGVDVAVSWKKAHPEIIKGSPVNYQGVQVGYVSTVKTSQQNGEGIIASVRLDEKQAHYIKERTTFIIRTNNTGQAFLDTIVQDPSAPPVKPGAILVGSENDIQPIVSSVLLDWKRTGIFIAIIVAATIVPLLLLRLLMKIWALAICGIAGLASILLLKPHIEPYILPNLPAGIPPELAMNGVAFLLGATICMLLLGFLRFGKGAAQ